jgi:hypothetical protein
MNIRKLSDELQKVACTELNEVPNRLQDDVLAIRLWLSQNPSMKSRDNDQFLVGFLRGCKFSLEKTKRKLEMFYTARSQTPEFFKNRDVNDKTLLAIIDQGDSLT